MIQSLFTQKYYPPYIITGHGADVLSLNKGIFKSIKQYAINHAAAITVVSNPLKDKLQSSFNIDEQDFRVISMGCDINRFSPKYRVEGYFEKYGLYSPVVLFVGRLAEKKGIEYLIKAFKILSTNQTNASLAIVGDGPMKVRLVQLTKELGLDSCIRFIEAQNHSILPTIYASADIFCAPSIIAKDGDAEGLPTVLIEAGSSGLPVVSTRVSGIPEVILDKRTGLLVNQRNSDELAEALTTLLKSSELRMRMGMAARDYVQRYDWTVIGDKFASLIMDTIHKRES
ncbi:MAG: glycosyltransferase family 4 protein, partial [Bacilli bacterium]